MISQPPPASSSPADSWLTPPKFALLLGGLIVACFASVVTGSETFYFRDYGGFTYPLAMFHKESFWRGEIPLWNPYNNCGLPFLAQWNSLTLYPGSLIYLLLPLPWSLGMFCLAHMFLAGLGAYFLARRWTQNNLAASVAGVAFAFNGLTWYSLMWTNNIAALGWMPWVVLAVESAWQRGTLRSLALAALAGAMQMLAGAPEVIMLTWCAIGTFWLAQFISGEIPRRRMVISFAVVLALVTALAAAQLLPFLDLLKHSHRDVNFGDAKWAMPASGWANYLVPEFHTDTTGPGQFWTGSYYLGVGTVALACLAIACVRSRRLWVLLILAAISLLMALGENGFAYSLLRRAFPQMGFMRFPIKFVILATFAIPFLAAHAVAWWQSIPPEKSSAGRNRLLLVVAPLLLAALGLAAYSHVMASGLSRVVFLAGIVGCLIALRQPLAPRLQILLRVCLLLLFWFDIFTHTADLSPKIEKSVYEPDTIRTYAKWHDELTPGYSRAMPTPTSVLKMMYQVMGVPRDDFYGRRLALFADYNVLDHAAKVDGFYSLYLKEENALNVWLYTVTNGLAPLKDFLGVSHISNPTNTTDWILRDSFMPMLTAGQEPVFADDATSYQGMISETFDPRTSVYLPVESRTNITAKRQPDVKISVIQVRAKTINAEVDTSAPSMLVVAQAFYHPWRAYVDDSPVPLLRANYAFQALEVPSGHHHIKVSYEDHAFRAGVIVSVIGLGACAAMLLLKRKGS